MMNLKRYQEFLSEKKKINLEAAPFSLENRPDSDKDIRQEKRFIKRAIKLFDSIFGTDYYKVFATDLRALVGKDVYFSKEVLEALSKEALKPEVYSKFNLAEADDELSDCLYDYLMRGIISDSVDVDKIVEYINSKIPTKISKTKLFYKFFLKFGSEFNNEVIKDVLEVKTGFELKGDCDEMNKSVQREFLQSMKKTMDRYPEKVKKNRNYFININEFFKYAIEDFLNSDISNVDNIKKDYIKKRLSDWTQYLETE